jgi:hypothetical protein
LSDQPWKRYAFAIVPAAGLLELGAHVAQTQSGPRDADWAAARAYVSGAVKPEDLVAFAPRWVDPIALQHFGPQIATLERTARADETRFPRAFEVSIRGAHLPEFARWQRSAERRFGAVSVTTWENPAPATVIDDLVSMATEQTMRVSRVDAGSERDCPFTHLFMQSGGLGYGPTIPGERFICPSGGFVGKTIVADLAYLPHRTIYAPALGGGTVLRLRFLGVRMGHALHGHHGLDAEAERHREGAPVTIVFKAGDSVLGSVVHRDGEGWKPFEFDTGQLAGQKVDLVAEITAPSGHDRKYCFEADTR